MPKAWPRSLLKFLSFNMVWNHRKLAKRWQCRLLHHCWVCRLLKRIYNVCGDFKSLQSVLHICSKQMFTSVFTNKYLYSDTCFRIVTFSCFHFITCTRNKTILEEIVQRRRDIPADSSTRLVFRHLALRIVYSEHGTSCNFICKVILRVPQTKMCRTEWRSPLNLYL